MEAYSDVVLDMGSTIDCSGFAGTVFAIDDELGPGQTCKSPLL